MLSASNGIQSEASDVDKNPTPIAALIDTIINHESQKFKAKQIFALGAVNRILQKYKKPGYNFSELDKRLLKSFLDKNLSGFHNEVNEL